MCLVAFQKIFRKIFSGVWKRRRKTQIQKKTQATTQKKNRDQRRERKIRDRDRRFARSRRRSRSREEGEIAIAPSIVISDRERAGAVVGLEPFSSLMIFFFWVVACVFLFVFSFFFSKHQKIFSGKFFEMQPNTWKYFPFPEISISRKYVFSGKHFTATKHSLNFSFIIHFSMV